MFEVPEIKQKLKLRRGIIWRDFSWFGLGTPSCLNSGIIPDGDGVRCGAREQTHCTISLATW